MHMYKKIIYKNLGSCPALRHELQTKSDIFDRKYKELLNVQAECFDGGVPSQ